jgi:hypothetical protein
VCKTKSTARKQQQQQQRPKTPAFLHTGNAGTCDAESSWSSAFSTVSPTADVAAAAFESAAPTAAPAAAAAAAAVSEDADSMTRMRSLPVPISCRGSAAFRGSSCPTDWNPGLDGGDAAVSCPDSAPAAAVGAAGGNSTAVSCPPSTCSLAAEIAAADAAAAAAAVAGDAGAAADSAEGSRGGWRAVTRQRSSSGNGTGSMRLSDSASSTGMGDGRGSCSKGGVGSLAADADAEDSSVDAAAEIEPKPGHGVEDLVDSPRREQQQQQQHGHGQRLATGVLAAAFANAKHGPEPHQQQQGADLAQSPPDVGQVAPSSPTRRLLGMVYKRSKSSLLEVDGVSHPHMHLACSAPDVLSR